MSIDWSCRYVFVCQSVGGEPRPDTGADVVRRHICPPALPAPVVWRGGRTAAVSSRTFREGRAREGAPAQVGGGGAGADPAAVDDGEIAPVVAAAP